MRRPVILAAVGLLCLLLSVFPRVNPTVGAAQTYTKDVATVAAATYVSLRVINAALSLVQEAEIGGSLGVSANVQPLKWVEPVDDTVERVAGFLFAVAALAGVASLSLSPLASIGFALAGAGLLALALSQQITGFRFISSLRDTAMASILAGLVLALLLPAAFSVGAWAGERLTRGDMAGATAIVDDIASEAGALIEPGEFAGEDERSWMSRQRDAVTGYLGAAGLFWDRADDLLSASLTLAAGLLLRLLVLPVVLVIALWMILRRAL